MACLLPELAPVETASEITPITNASEVIIIGLNLTLAASTAASLMLSLLSHAIHEQTPR